MRVADRVMELEGVHNFRDYGGYAIVGGGRLKKRVLWRSGQHAGATGADLQRISEINLQSVFDLRTSTERKAHPCRRPEGFTGILYTTEPRSAGHAPHVAAAKPTERRSAAGTRDGMRRSYERIAFRPEFIGLLRRYLENLSEGHGPSLINCMAGKDRTGIAVAVLHSAVGVHHDDIMADYLLTNVAGSVEARIAAGRETIAALTGPIDDDVLRVLMGVEPEYLETAFASIIAQCGSLDGYLTEVLGTRPDIRAKLRDALVAA